MEMLFLEVNWLAVVVGAILSFFLGWVWYSTRLFGTQWAKDVGTYTQDSTTSSSYALLMQGLGTFLLAWVIGITETTNSFALALLFGITTTVLILANGLFARKSMYAVKTESGYVFAMVVVMILTHTVL
jgi:hypothetical protein